MNIVNTFILTLFCIIAITSCNANTKIDENSNHHIIAGGYSAISVNDKSVLDAANNAILIKTEEMNKSEEKNMNKIKLIKILSAYQQVVAGTNYSITLKLNINGNEQIVDTVVWWQAWNKESPYRVTSWNVK